MFYSSIIPLVLLFEIAINCVFVTAQLEEGELCTTDSGKRGTCMLIEKCSTALSLVRNRGKPKVCSFQGKVPIVCCENVVSRTLSIATKKCLKYRNPQLLTRQIIPVEEGDVMHAVGGVDAIPLEFPHMAILGYGDSNNTRWLCGGSLISENFVLTAAHCIVSRYGNISIVKLGLHQISATNMFIQIFQVKNTYQYPEYNPLERYHDIALIELDRPADITSGVQPACLHTSKELPKNLLTGTGWGATELYGDISDILQKVNLSYVPYNKCESYYKGKKALPKGLIDDWQICADGGGARADTCQGDSGGPIQVARDENTENPLHTIVGITSFGIKCAIVPAIYTRISYYVPWIESIVWPNYGNVTIVKLGLHQISEPNVFVQHFKVKNTYQHPEYNPVQNYHDIALIELNHGADINAGVKPACLHTSKELPNNSLTGTGWGATELYGSNSDILQKVNLSYVPYSSCASFYRGKNKLPNGLIDDWQICADGGGARADTCQGDSGGPIQLPRDKNVRASSYTIVGITSVGIKCAIVPAIYTRISYYVPWIESIVWPN